MRTAGFSDWLFPLRCMVSTGQTNSVLGNFNSSTPIGTEAQSHGLHTHTRALATLFCELSALQLSLPAMNRKGTHRRLHPGSSLPGEGMKQWPGHLVMLRASCLGHCLRRLRRWHDPHSAASSVTETSAQTTAAHGVPFMKRQGGMGTEYHTQNQRQIYRLS